jgi:hypothetical protein
MGDEHKIFFSCLSFQLLKLIEQEEEAETFFFFLMRRRGRNLFCPSEEIKAK